MVNGQQIAQQREAQRLETSLRRIEEAGEALCRSIETFNYVMHIWRETDVPNMSAVSMMRLGKETDATFNEVIKLSHAYGEAMANLLIVTVGSTGSKGVTP